MQVGPKFDQISKNTQKMPNKIFAAGPLLKRSNFSQFRREKANFPALVGSSTVGRSLIHSNQWQAEHVINHISLTNQNECMFYMVCELNLVPENKDLSVLFESHV